MGNAALFLHPILIIKHNLDRIWTKKAYSRKQRPMRLRRRRVEHLEGSFDERETVHPHILQMSLNSATQLLAFSRLLSIRFRCFSFLSLAPSLSSFFLFLELRLPSFPFGSVGVFYGSFFQKCLQAFEGRVWRFSGMPNAYFLHGISLITYNLQTHMLKTSVRVCICHCRHERLASPSWLLFYHYLSLGESASFLIIVSHWPISLPRAFLRGHFLKLCALVMYLR